MKWSDLLKKLGVTVDDDIELEDDKHDEKPDEKKVEDSKDKDNTDKMVQSTIKIDLSNLGKEETEDMDFKNIKFDTSTGLFDLTNIENSDLRSKLEESNNHVKAMQDSFTISRELDNRIASLKLHKGITGDAVRKLIDISAVKVEDGKVTGLDEAFDTLQKEQSGLFVNKGEKESSPVLEGYHPASGNGAVDNSIDAALSELAEQL